MASYPDYTESIAQLEGVQARSLGTIGNAIQAAPEAIGAAGAAMEGIGKNLDEARFTALKAQGLDAMVKMAQDKGHTPEQITMYKALWNQPDGQNKAYLMFSEAEKQNYQKKMGELVANEFSTPEEYMAAKADADAKGIPLTPPTAPPAMPQPGTQAPDVPAPPVTAPPAIGELGPQRMYSIPAKPAGPAAETADYVAAHPESKTQFLTPDFRKSQATTPGAATPNTAPGKAVSPMYKAPDGETPSNTMTGNTDNINLKKLNMPVENQKDFNQVESITKARLKAMGVSQETLDAMTPTLELMAAIHFNQPKSERAKFLKKIQSNPILMADLTRPDSAVRKAIESFPDTVDKDNFLTAIGTYSAKTFDTITKAQTAEDKMKFLEEQEGRKFTQQDKTEAARIKSREGISDDVIAMRIALADQRIRQEEMKADQRWALKEHDDRNKLAIDFYRFDTKYTPKSMVDNMNSVVKDFGLFGGDRSKVQAAGFEGFINGKYPKFTSFAESAARALGADSLADYMTKAKDQKQALQKLAYQTILKYAATTFSYKTEENIKKIIGENINSFTSVDELVTGLEDVVRDTYNDQAGAYGTLKMRARWLGMSPREFTSDFSFDEALPPAKFAKALREGKPLTNAETPVSEATNSYGPSGGSSVSYKTTTKEPGPKLQEAINNNPPVRPPGVPENFIPIRLPSGKYSWKLP